MARQPGSGQALTRRELMRRGGAAIAGAAAVGAAGCGAHRPDYGGGPGRRLSWVLDMVQDNAGQPPTRTSFKDPHKLAAYGYDGQIIDDFRPPTTAVTLDSFDAQIFPRGSTARAWVQRNAARIEARLAAIHAAGLKALYHTDLILFPTRLVERHRSLVLDDRGRISLDRPMTRRIQRLILAEVFERFPDLDGLVIRTGEVYLQNLPYHTGNDPITRGAASHLMLLDMLRQEACVKRGKLIFYRTWSFDGFHTVPDYYLDVTNRVRPHPLLTFSIKHTKGDFWRTVPFNPTLGIGRHHQIVEVECQREYEGKAAYPNYIGHGVIDGFQELAGSSPPVGLAGLAGRPQFDGVMTWSRGGGWNGPYIDNELWCDLNVYVVSQWARNRGPSERAVFDAYMTRTELSAPDRARFRQLALVSAGGVLHGHYSTVRRLARLAWTRDMYLGGSDRDLRPDFQAIIERGLVEPVLAEKRRAILLWSRVAALADQIRLPNPAQQSYARVSSRFGLLLFSIIAHGWEVMLRGLHGDLTGHYDATAIRRALRAYDLTWHEYERLRANHGDCPTLYVPYSFQAPAGPRLDPTADPHHGMKPSVDRYRAMLG